MSGARSRTRAREEMARQDKTWLVVSKSKQVVHGEVSCPRPAVDSKASSGQQDQQWTARPAVAGSAVSEQEHG